MPIMRSRLSLCAVAVIASLAVVGCAAPAPTVSPPLGELISIDQGELLGATDGSVLRYRGIPYAAAPFGDLRF